jgi:hypothetical protein
MTVNRRLVAGLLLLALATSASAVPSEVASVDLDGTCLRLGMTVRQVAAQFDTGRWQFRWDEKMISRDGLVGALIDRSGRENPYVVAFQFGQGQMSDAKLTRIGPTGPPGRPC